MLTSLADRPYVIASRKSTIDTKRKRKYFGKSVFPAYFWNLKKLDRSDSLFIVLPLNLLFIDFSPLFIIAINGKTIDGQS